MSLKFYRDEWERHPLLSKAKATPEEAEAAIRKLTRHYFGNHKDAKAAWPNLVDYRTKPISVEFKRAGSSWGHAHGGYSISLPENPSWLLIAHEFAHIYEVRKYGSTEHRRRMARVVDRIVAYIEKKSWATESIDRKFDLWCQTQLHSESIDSKIEALPIAACPAPIPEATPEALADAEHELDKEAKRIDLDKRIAKREAQIKRLERRAKSIATRLKKAARSLKALQRSRERLKP